MDTINESPGSPELEAGLGTIRRAASALEPPPELEARLRRQLFARTAVAAPSTAVATSAVTSAVTSVAAPVAVPVAAASAVAAPSHPLSALPAAGLSSLSHAGRAVASKVSTLTGRATERWAAWLVWPVTVTATIVLCSWMLVAHPALDPALDSAMDAASSAAGLQAQRATDARDNGTPFLALAPLDEIAAAGQSEVVTASVPRATLAEFGLPVSPMHAGDDIAAEFLVAPSGGVLAVRFVVADLR